MEKIDIHKIRGIWQYNDNKGTISGGDDTLESIRMVAEKLNEVIEEIETLKQIKIIVTKDK